MNAAEALIILIFLALILFALYYFLKGSTGRVVVTRPIESRIDEYLDRRFEDMVSEWSLTTKSKLNRFKRKEIPRLENNEARVAELKTFEKDMNLQLDNLEERLNGLEKELVAKKKESGKGKKGKSKKK
jgi:small nuclear ribonucleoprotein (snRNP)-like protein